MGFGQGSEIADLGASVRLVHLPGGPLDAPVDTLYTYLPLFLEALYLFAAQGGRPYQVVHSHYWLSGAAGTAIFVAFVLYAIGQTYYWPCVLGFVSERYPSGGALTLNTVSAIGLLSAGIVGGPILGAAFDKSIHAAVVDQAPELAEAATAPGSFMWMSHEKIAPPAAKAFIEGLPEGEKAGTQSVYDASEVAAGRDVLSFAAIFPATLFVAFGLISIHFRSRGGYKPIDLQAGVDRDFVTDDDMHDASRESPFGEG